MTDEPRDVDEFDDELDEEPEELTREQLEHLYKRLNEERSTVKKRLERHLAEAVEDSDNLPDEMDIASRQSDQAYLLRLADKEKKLLRMIDHALAKFERGTFGICEGTEEPIGFKRLDLKPWARYSLEHQEQLEHEKGGRARR